MFEQELPYLIESVSFQDNQITIVYLNTERESQSVTIAETMMFRPDVVGGERIRDVLMLLCDWVDDASVALRNPPTRLR